MYGVGGGIYQSPQQLSLLSGYKLPTICPCLEVLLLHLQQEVVFMTFYAVCKHSICSHILQCKEITIMHYWMQGHPRNEDQSGSISKQLVSDSPVHA